MTDRSGTLWTDEELDIVAQWVRARKGIWKRDDLARLVTRLERSTFAAEQIAVQIAMVGGLKPASSTVAWYREALRELGDHSRCLQAWKRSEPETPAETARRLGFGDILE